MDVVELLNGFVKQVVSAWLIGCGRILALGRMPGFGLTLSPFSFSSRQRCRSDFADLGGNSSH